jgi:hypothetical protein
MPRVFCTEFTLLSLIFSLNAVYMTASFPGELEFIFSLEEHWIQYTPWEIDGDNIISMRIFWGCSLFWERRVMFTSLCLLCSQQFLNSLDFAHLSGTTSRVVSCKYDFLDRFHCHRIKVNEGVVFSFVLSLANAQHNSTIRWFIVMPWLDFLQV